jgi:putrescine transport system substrate-binding protein
MRDRFTGARAARLLARGVAVGIAASVLAACGSHGSTDTSTAPHEEKVLNVYNWADYIGKHTISDFERTTGIRVVYDTYDADTTLEARMMAGDSGYDVVSTSTDFFSRQIKAGVYRPLDRAQLSNWGNIDPHALEVTARSDPGNRYAVPYLHAINGFAYNAAMIKARMPDAPVDSLDMLFKPDIVRRFADCGVTFLDSASDVLPLALNYLHRDPNSTRAEDYAAAAQLLLTVRGYVRAFDSVEYMNDLANQELCIAMSWSSDYATARARAREAGTDVDLVFTVPREGANITYDALLIPAGAPHPDNAHRFINYILEPRVVAEITNEIHYANNNRAADPYVDPQIRNDPALYPSPEIEARLYEEREANAALERIRTRTWTRVKTGE